MIHFQNVTKRYGEKIVLKNLNLEIRKGEFVVLIGPSGCGKTTTLKMINRLIEPDSGRIFINGEDASKQNAVELRRKIGYVIQQIGLFPNMTVEQNIAIVPKLLKYPKEEWQSIVRSLLKLVDMPYEDYAHKYPSELSGGQQQRIGVLRALAVSPPIVLMDEPFGALDPITRDSLQEEVRRIQKKLKKTIVFVTHDMGEALRMADTIVFMNEGRIVQKAAPEEMLRNPADSIISTFMGRHITSGRQSVPLYAEDFMRTKVLKVPKTSKTLECIELMSRRDVNSLIVIEDDETYFGTVTIEEIKQHGKAGRNISELVSNETITIGRKEDARTALDRLLESAANYLIVLNDDLTVAGIVTRTSTAKALGEALWGEMPA
ncbi:MAG: glycine betaine/L-proline transporter, ATPase subunit [Bacillales bacterium]|jgi:osmoprotectant transport system ATP-binding protein|nr:glycine betaine/L-proline transporter, ATPase subunit [Bacillales bacterium]